MRASIITHAGTDIGGGHLSRCLALSQGLNEIGFDVSWILNDSAQVMASDFQIANASFVDDPFSGGACQLSSKIADADIIIVDSYACDADFFDLIKEITKSPVAYISDGPQYIGVRCADILIDYSLIADHRNYELGSRIGTLLGPKYALLRRDFWHLESSCGENVLLIPGASDVAGVSETVLSWWSSDLASLDIVLGPLVPKSRAESLCLLAEKKHNIHVLNAPSDLPYRIANAGCVVCSASVTMYEALAMRKRTVIFTVADNQTGVGDKLSSKGIAEDLGNWKDVLKDRFTEAIGFMPNSSALMDAVDPCGAVNCANAILRLIDRS